MLIFLSGKPSHRKHHMINSKKEIIPGVGIEDVKFSMTQEEVIKLLGNPAGVDDSIAEQPVYYYDEIGLAIVFQWLGRHYKIHSFEIDRDLYTLWQAAVIGQPYEAIVELIKDNGVKDYVEYNSNSASEYISLYQSQSCGFYSAHLATGRQWRVLSHRNNTQVVRRWSHLHQLDCLTVC